MEKLPRSSQKLWQKVEYSHEDELWSAEVLDDLADSNNNEAYTNTGFDMLTSTDRPQSSSFDKTTSNGMNWETMRLSSTGVDEEISRQVCSNNHDFDDSFINDEENYSGIRTSRLGSSGSSDLNEQSRLSSDPKTYDEEFAASQTTEVILAEIFGKNTRIPKQKSFKTRCSNGEGSDETSENGIEYKSRGGIEPGLIMRNKGMNPYNDLSPKRVYIDERNTESSRPSTLRHRPVIQSNVIDYYEKLRNEGAIESQRKSSFTERMTPRKGLRSKSSEMPVKDALPNLYSPSR